MRKEREREGQFDMNLHKNENGYNRTYHIIIIIILNMYKYMFILIQLAMLKGKKIKENTKINGKLAHCNLFESYSVNNYQLSGISLVLITGTFTNLPLEIEYMRRKGFIDFYSSIIELPRNNQ